MKLYVCIKREQIDIKNPLEILSHPLLYVVDREISKENIFQIADAYCVDGFQLGNYRTILYGPYTFYANTMKLSWFR